MINQGLTQSLGLTPSLLKSSQLSPAQDFILLHSGTVDLNCIDLRLNGNEDHRVERMAVFTCRPEV